MPIEPTDRSSAASIDAGRSFVQIIGSGLKSLSQGINQTGDRGHVARGVVGTFGLKVANVLLGLVTTMLLARMLGVDGYGVYAYVIALVGMLAIPTQMGLPEFILRQVARYQARNQWDHLRGLVVRANQVVLAASTVLLVAAVSTAWFVRDRFDNEALLAFLTALILLPILSMTALRLSILRGLRYPLLGQLPETLIRPGLFGLALLVVATTMSEGWLTPVSAVAISVAATIVAFCFGAAFLAKRLPAEVKRTEAFYDTRNWATGAVPFLLIGGTYLLNTKIDVVLLGFFRSSVEVGIYAIAVKLSTLMAFGAQSIAMVANAQFAHYWSKDEVKRVQRLATWAARAALALVLPVGLVFILGGDKVIELIFGPDFLPGARPLMILCAGWIVVAGMGPVDPLLKMTGHEKSVVRAVAYTTALNVGGNLALIPHFGAEGAAIATAASLIFKKCIMLYYVRNRLHMNPTILRAGT
jgi:O-antigen/teichoic acid export membrane protein